ncbi:SLC13 family permease [Biformimicrobium ophioploci]|uniref:SLC13 family permease n=1 Tax=Biformimicrobium ophioploci TaxID=3036711 RepID=A0ABQ6M196_9GAMM|nr:SLC13 family permease [Microbulbifer sp. NKW57]GMG88138.1 SLC13 family permease [Microbulbifer sp. NKW57]
MTSYQFVVASLFLLVIGALIFSRFRPSMIFAVALLGSYLSGAVSTEEMLGKAVNPGLVTLLVLIMVSVGLEKASWIKSISDKLLAGGYYPSLLKLTGVTALGSAFLNNTAIVAALSGAVRKQKRYPASRLLIPLSYAAILGGTMTLIGTSTNLIVNSFVLDQGEPGLSFFAFLPIGLAAVVCGILVVLLTNRLLPTLATEEEAEQDYLIEAKISRGSTLHGKTVTEAGLRNLETLFLVELIRSGHCLSPVSPAEIIEEGDRLIFSGDIQHLERLRQLDGIELFAEKEDLDTLNLTEVVVRPNAGIEGKTLRETNFRSQFDAAVIAIRRGGDRLYTKLGELALRPGDGLLLAVGPDFIKHGNIDKNFYIISGTQLPQDLSRKQNLWLGIGFLFVILGAALEWFPLLKGLVGLLGLMVGTGMVSTSEIKRRFPFQLWLIIAGALVIAQALTNSGLVQLVADSLHSSFAGWGPVAALVGVFLATLVLTEIMTNNAAAALMFPLAWSLAESFGVSWMPFVMAVAYGASASFLTPFGYQTNLMVQNIGGYHTRDFARAGIFVSITYALVVLTLLPVVFPF